MDQLRAIKYFVKVVENGSFSKAAEFFSVPPSSLSRRVADLEKMLGATLLKRTTRAVSLTEIGKIYYQQVSEVLQLLAQCDETVKNYQARPMGVLNISSMVGFGERILLPLLDEFNRLYPEITLNVSLSDELSTLGRDEVDLAIRGGYAPDERVIAVRLMDNYFIMVAAPAYLSTFGTPVDALELKQHKGLYFKTPNGPIPWICEIQGQRQDVSAEQVLISNNGKWLLDKTIAGAGILMMPHWVLKPYIESGELQELPITPPLDITTNRTLGVFLLYQKQRYQVPKIKAAVDFLVARVKGAY
ncbi:LysR family transcriptional regulator [Psychromonas hadalis]|uniref:LysR family transcriptional regulator n=1 Tax=Psychromonas hadalis TaxID=211669 RepID=UPI0003B723AF|nr:LysR family transcriptional regulator [Psychromonas hadalis]